MTLASVISLWKWWWCKEKNRKRK